MTRDDQPKTVQAHQELLKRSPSAIVLRSCRNDMHLGMEHEPPSGGVVVFGRRAKKEWDRGYPVLSEQIVSSQIALLTVDLVESGLLVPDRKRQGRRRQKAQSTKRGESLIAIGASPESLQAFIASYAYQDEATVIRKAKTSPEVSPR